MSSRRDWNLRRHILTLTLASLAACPAAAGAATGDHRPGELLVRFRDGAPAAARSRSHAARGARTVQRFQLEPALERVQLPPDVTVEDAVAAYQSDPGVLWAEPDWQLEAFALPNDPQFSKQWGLRNVGQDIGVETSMPVVPGIDISAPEAWDITTGDDDVVVAVIDTGVFYRHPDLAPNMFRNEADCDADGDDDDGNGYADDCHGIDAHNDHSDPNDDNRHGTHVAATIGAATNEGFGVAGVAWDVRILACKFLNQQGGGFVSDAVECLDYVAAMKDRGVRIVATNNSWGGRNYSQALADAIERQREHGILFIAAAGNSAADMDVFDFRPGGLYLPNVIAVAATAPDGTLAGFSNHGRHSVHLSAPGVAILSADRSGWVHLNGTSMATPHVTGVAVLLAAQDPSRDWRALRNLLLTGATPMAEPDRGTIVGGMVDAYGSLTCSGREVQARIAPTTDAILVSAGVALGLAAIHVECAEPAGGMSVTVSPGGEVIELVDDGAGFDQVAGDGTYSAYFVPPADGTYTLEFPDGPVEATAGPGVIGAPLASAGRLFGWSIVAMGDDFVIGAPGDATNEPHAGAVYVVDGASARVVQTILNPEPLGGDAFGVSLAVSGDRILVGAPWASRGAPGAGSAYLIDALTGGVLHRFDSPDPEANGGFGTAVAFVGDLIAISAPWQAGVNRDSGAIHFFDDAGALVSTMAPQSGLPPYLFGYRLTAEGTTLFTSNNSPDVWGASIDADPSSPTFLLEQAQYYGLAVLAGGYGRTIAVAGPWALAGDPYTAVGPMEDLIGAGSVAVSEKATGFPHPLLPLIRPPEQVEYDNFGQALTADGDRIYVGAPYAPTYDAGHAQDGYGAVFVFDLVSGGLVRRYERPVHGYDDGFGWSVAIVGDNVVIGAPTDRDPGPAAGAAYLYPKSTEPAVLHPQLYGCFRARKERTVPPVRVPLLGPHGVVQVPHTRHERLCAPAREIGLAVPDFAMNLGCYGSDLKLGRRETVLRTSLADEPIALSGKAIGCLPARRIGTTTVLPRRAWQCRKARRSGRSETPRHHPMNLEMPTPAPYYVSQFNVELKSPKLACSEVDVDSGAQVDPSRKLLCYSVKTETLIGNAGGSAVQTDQHDVDHFNVRGLDMVCMQATEIAP